MPKQKTDAETIIFTVRAFPTREQRIAIDKMIYINTQVFNRATYRRREIDEFIKNENIKLKGMSKEEKENFKKLLREKGIEEHSYTSLITYDNILDNNYFLTKEDYEKYFNSSAINWVFTQDLKTQQDKVLKLRKEGKPADYNFRKHTEANSFRTGTAMGNWEIIKVKREYYLKMPAFNNNRNFGMIKIAIDKKYWHKRVSGVTKGKSATMVRGSVNIHNSKYLIRLTVTLPGISNAENDN